MSTNVQASHRIAATFAINPYTITASAGANGAISPSGAVGVNYGSNQAFTITPNTGYHVADVLVDGSSVGAVTSYTFTNVTANHTIAASFAINTYTMTVTLAGNGSGTVALDPDQAKYDWGSTVQLTANPAVSSNFAGWSGDTTGTANPITFTVQANKSVTATFTLKQLTITASAGANGAISPSGSVGVNYGANQAFTITPNTGYHVADVLVDGSSVGAVTSYTFTNVTANHTIAASFAINTYTMTVTLAGNGSGTVALDPDQAKYDWGSTVQLTANPAVSSNFAGWSGDTTGTANPITFTVQANKSVTATFTLKQLTITASAGANGAISPSGSVVVNYGSSQAFTMTPSTGYHVADVLVDGASVGAVTSYTFTNVTASHTIAASFAINTYTMTVTTVGNGSGTVTKNPNQATYDWGSTVQLTANPAVSSNFTGWSGDTTGTGNPITFTMRANKSVTATFTLKQFTITASAGANGVISPSGSVVVNYGSSQAFTITPNTGYHVADVLVDGSSVGAVTSYTFTNVTATHTIAASFAIDTYTITATAGADGAISPNGAVAVNSGASQAFTITPDAGHHVTNVLVDGSSVGAVTSYTFTNVTATHTIAASFAIDTYTLTASAGPNGAISPSGAVSANSGASQAFTITPDATHHVADVLVDGSSVGAVTSIALTNVSTPLTVHSSIPTATYT